MMMLGKTIEGKKFLLPEKDRYGKTPGGENILTIRKQKKSPLYFIEACKLLRRLKPDTIYFLKPNPYSMIPALRYRLTHKCRLIFDCDEWDPATLKDNKAPFYKVWISEILSKVAIRISDRIVISNKKILDKIPRKHHRKTLYIPNGVNTNLFKPEKVAKASLFSLMYVGSMHKIDQITPMLEAVRKTTDVKLVLVGPGNISELKRNAPENVEFTGEVEHMRIPETISTADALIAVFPKLESLSYASNIKIFEYMAMQKPIIATDVGETKELLDSGKAGYVVDEATEEKIVQAIERIQKNPKEASEKAAYARKLAVRKYDWRVLSEKLARELY